MASRLSRTTQDHDEIRRWAEARHAVPCEVASTRQDGEAGILRLCFPKSRNRNDAALHEIDWNQFFEKFDQNGLSMVYQEKTAGGARSNFNKLIHAESESSSGSRGRSSSSHAASGRTANARSADSHASGSRASGSRSSESRSTSSTRRSSKSHGHSSRHHAA
ncbi:MAG TPA: hypothetical protein VF126_03590 [Acidobacteriaceae bacterium]